MKKYIAPKAQILSLNAEFNMMLTMSGNKGNNLDLSNNRVSVDEDWDDEE